MYHEIMGSPKTYNSCSEKNWRSLCTSTNSSKTQSQLPLQVAKLEVSYNEFQYLICWHLCEYEIYILELCGLMLHIRPSLDLGLDESVHCPYSMHPRHRLDSMYCYIKQRQVSHLHSRCMGTSNLLVQNLSILLPSREIIKMQSSLDFRMDF